MKKDYLKMSLAPYFGKFVDSFPRDTYFKLYKCGQKKCVFQGTIKEYYTNNREFALSHSGMLVMDAKPDYDNKLQMPILVISYNEF